MAFGSAQRLAALRRAVLASAGQRTDSMAQYGMQAGQAISQYGRDLEQTRQFDAQQKIRQAEEARKQAAFAEKQKQDLERLAMESAMGKMAGMRLQGGQAAPPGMGDEPPGMGDAPPAPSAPQSEVDRVFDPKRSPLEGLDLEHIGGGKHPAPAPAAAPAPAPAPVQQAGLQTPDLNVAAQPIQDHGLDPTIWRQHFIDQGIDPERAETLANNFVADEMEKRSMAAVNAAAAERAMRQKDFENKMELASKQSIMAKRQVETQKIQAELHDAVNGKLITEQDAAHLEDFRDMLSRAHQFKDSDPKWVKYLSLVGEQTYGRGFKYTGDPKDPRQDAVRQAANDLAFDYAKGAAEGQVKGPEDLLRAFKRPDMVKKGVGKAKRINLLKELPAEMQKGFGVVESAEDFRRAADKVEKIPSGKVGFVQKMITELQGAVGDVTNISDDEIKMWQAKGSHSFAITAHIRRISGAAVTDGEALRVLQTVGGDLDKLDGPTVAKILRDRADDFERNAVKTLIAAIGTSKVDEMYTYPQAESIAATYGPGFLRSFRSAWAERQRALSGASQAAPAGPGGPAQTGDPKLDGILSKHGAQPYGGN